MGPLFSSSWSSLSLISTVALEPSISPDEDLLRVKPSRVGCRPSWRVDEDTEEEEAEEEVVRGLVLRL